MKLRILCEAEEEAQSSAIWYDEQSSGLGDDFLQEFASALDQIQEDPYRFPMLETLTTQKQIRRVRLARFPYLVIFEVLESESVVLAVAHARRRPNYWRQRD